MDPITAAIGIAGLGIQLFGAGGAFGAQSKEAGIAKQESELSQQNTRLQMQENSQRQLAMQISARRAATEDTRKAQLQSSQSLSAGVNQGAQFSSGAQAGQQQATAGGAYNIQGINQNLEIGNTLFGIQNQISGNQIAMAGLQSQMSTQQGQASIFQGIGSIGGSLAGSAGPLGSILGNFFGNSGDPTAKASQSQGSRMGYLVNQ